MRNSLLELFFPRFCLGCGYVGVYLCQRCELGMKRVKRERCFYCGRSSLLGLTHPNCKTKGGLDGYISIYSYNGLFRKLLQESKYKGAHLVLRSLLSFPQESAIMCIEKWSKLFKPVVVCVPLHPQRLRERGFNQAHIIMSGYFKNIAIPSPVLERIQNTIHIAHINSKTKRKKIIKSAFKVYDGPTPKTALLIDDVITSGATILECAKTLKESGVQTVLAFSLAKG